MYHSFQDTRPMNIEEGQSLGVCITSVWSSGRYLMYLNRFWNETNERRWQRRMVRLSYMHCTTHFDCKIEVHNAQFIYPQNLRLKLPKPLIYSICRPICIRWTDCRPIIDRWSSRSSHQIPSIFAWPKSLGSDGGIIQTWDVLPWEQISSVSRTSMDWKYFALCFSLMVW